MMKLKGLKKAVGTYQRWNAGGPYDSMYGVLMLDLRDGSLWTDTFCSIGHNEWCEYHSDKIVDLGSLIYRLGDKVCMNTVKKYAQEAIDGEYDYILCPYYDIKKWRNEQ